LTLFDGVCSVKSGVFSSEIDKLATSVDESSV
jgi:hypothetical protein